MVVPVFVFDDDVLAHVSDAQIRFMLDALAELHEHYRERGSDLLTVRGNPAANLLGWTDLTDEQRERTADHPHSIVDHLEAREAAIAMFEGDRGDHEET